MTLPILKLRTPAQLVTAIPYLVGFHPADSVVALSFHRGRGRLGLTMRADLAAEDEPGFVPGLVERLVLDGADSAVIAVYADELRRDLVDRMIAEVRTRGIGLRDAIHVGTDRWWSYVCTDEHCCPAAGTPLVAGAAPGGESEVAAVMTYAGMSVLPDRGSLEEQVRPVQLLARKAMAAALERAAVRPADSVRDESLQLLADLLARFGGRGATVTDDEAAVAIVALTDIPVRDEVCVWAATRRHDVPALLELLLELTRRALPPFDAPVATVLAATAYLEGNGALAAVALDRAFDTDPAYSLALLLAAALEGQVHPSALRAMWRKAAPEVRRLAYRRPAC